MKFIFEITNVNREILIKAPYAALDGNLTIDINHRLFFDKECVSLLELAIHVTSWLNEAKAGVYSDFDYSADSYQENPVLHFTKIDNQHYILSSAWVNTETEIRLEVAEMIRCFNNFLLELDNTMQQAYGIAFANIPLLKSIDKLKSTPLKGLLPRFWS